MHACIMWTLSRQNLSSGFPTKRNSNQSPQPTQTSLNIEILLEASLNIILSSRQITKALISLRGCADWSAPLLLARFSRDEAHVVY